jgi:transcription antitermination factor NusG
LKRAIDIRLESRLDWEKSLAPTPAPAWFAVRVKRHFETTVALHLGKNGFVAVLPMYRVGKEWSDRTKTVDVPLFPGYVFCEFDPADRLQIEYVPGVNGIVSFGNRPAEIDRSEMLAIQSAVSVGLSVAPWPRLEPGRKVEIHRGPLRGLTGVVLGDKNNYRLILSVTLLNRSISVEMDRRWLRV